MFHLNENTQVYIRTSPTDMRKSIDGLVALVIDEFQTPPQSGHLFVFCNRNRDKVKVVGWDKNGFALYYKRLDRKRFQFSWTDNGDALIVSHEQLSWLLAGLDFQLMREFSHLKYEHYY